ncbi:MAG: choice-of-anchor J domain-containing protein [Bacteroidales bacterium]|nr:choice-of-anchor J domain-containing protein [Bacteroidales bacterium]
MKKSFFFAGLAAALSLVGCNKETDVKGLDGRPVEIVLSDVATRTVNDGMSTKWENGDELSVFTAPAGTTTWSANTKFAVQDASTNRATGEVELTADAYDWYAFYPYTVQIPNPKSTSNEGKRQGYVTIGGQFQTQTTDGKMTHLAGNNVPLYGQAKSVSIQSVPSIPMKQAASVVRFHVQNKQTTPVKVQSIKFTAPTDIVGTYYIDFSGENATYEGSGDRFVYDNATLTVKNPLELGYDAGSSFYLVVKPFTAAAGSKLSVQIDVETSDGMKKGSVTKEITLDADVAFEAGRIKTLNVPFDGTLENLAPATLPYTEAFDGSMGDFTTEDKVGTGIWNPATASGQTCMKGTSFISGSNTEAESWLISPEIDATTAENGVKLSFKQCINKYFGNVAEEATLWAREKDGEWKQFTITYPALNGTWSAFEEQVVDLSEFKGKTFQFAFKYVGHATTAGTWEICNVAVTDEVVTYTFLAELQGESTVPANVTSVTIKVTGNVAWTAVPSDGVTLDKESGVGSAIITASFAANTDPVVKNYSVLVGTDNTEVANDEFEITFSQAAASTEAKTYPYEETFETSQGDFMIVDEKLGDGLTYVWKHDASNKYMKASAYAGSNKESVSWLVSPVVDLKDATSPALYFSQCISKYFGDVTKEATVWIKEEGGEWNQLTIEYPALSGNWSKMTDYTVDIKSYAGKKVQVGFKYTSSTSAAGTWEIKDFKLDEAVTGPVDPELTVSPSITVEEGKTATISVTTNSDGEKTWSTSDATVATVSNGVVTGVKPGSATITLSIAATANFNTKSATIPVTVTEVGLQDFTWDLTQASYDKASTSSVKWINDAATMETTQAAGATACNNYLGGDKTSTRFYSKNSLIFTPATGVTIIKVVYTATTDSYASTLANSTWTNATAVASGTEVVITPTDRTTAFSAVLGGTTGASSVKVYYTGTPVVVTLASITLSNPKTELIKGAEFDFGGTVTAHYSDGTTQDVTSEAQFSGYEMNTAGTYTVTVSYTEKGVTQTATYNLTVIVPTGGGTDILNQEFTGISGSSYTDFSGKVGVSGAVYAGQCAGSYQSIQLRSKNNNCGIITTGTGGKAKKVTVTWESNTVEGRTLNIYGKNTAYSSASDLYDEAKQGALLGSITCGTSTEVTISGDYTYIGFRSAADAMYLSEVKIVWE